MRVIIYVSMEDAESVSNKLTSENNLDYRIPESFCESTFEEEEVEKDPGPVRRHYSSNKKAWRGQYCCVPLCRSSSGERAERERLGMPRVSFHSFPDVTTCTGKMWIAKIRRDPGPDFVINKNTKVCSHHFTPDDYISGDVLHSARRVLKGTAVPSVFPWTREVRQRKSKTSQLAASVHQRSDVIEDKVYTPIENSDVLYYPAENCMEVEGSSADISEMQRKIDELQLKLAEVESAFKRSLLRLENIRDSDDMVKFYTSFPDYKTLIAFYEEVLESDAQVMRQWEGKNSKDAYDDVKTGRACNLPLLEQFFFNFGSASFGIIRI